MQWRTNILLDLKGNYLNELSELFGKNEARQMLNILIEHFFSLSRSEQLLQPGFRLNESEMLKLHNAVKDLKANKPVQYIIGETEFCGMKFFVDENVLIPRPETEELVELIVKNEKKEALKVLDIGTGTGCIAIALKRKLINAEVAALDVDAKALKIASRNAEINDAEIEFIEDDILNPNKFVGGKFDFIVSNPPYIRLSEKEKMQANVLEFEPHLALFVSNDDPLLFYKAIVGFAKQRLKSDGRVYFEINEALGNDLVKLMEENGFTNAKIHPDINGKSRMLRADLR